MNGKKGFSPTERGDKDGSKTNKGTGAGCIAMAQGGKLVLALGNTQ
jgi:hypothetical protein